MSCHDGGVPTAMPTRYSSAYVFSGFSAKCVRDTSAAFACDHGMPSVRAPYNTRDNTYPHRQISKLTFPTTGRVQTPLR